jgi:hypothetical protein
MPTSSRGVAGGVSFPPWESFGERSNPCNLVCIDLVSRINADTSPCGIPVVIGNNYVLLTVVDRTECLKGRKGHVTRAKSHIIDLASIDRGLINLGSHPRMGHSSCWLDM